MSKASFQIMGGFVLFFAAMLVLGDILWIGHYSLRLPPRVTTAGLARSAALDVTLALVGVGLLYLRKWAALVLSILLLYPAFWCVREAVHPVDLRPGDASWLGFLYAALLILPSVLTVKYWRTLVWRKKPSEGRISP